jgi:hypothetical protein
VTVYISGGTDAGNQFAVIVTLFEGILKVIVVLLGSERVIPPDSTVHPSKI